MFEDFSAQHHGGSSAYVGTQKVLPSGKRSLSHSRATEDHKAPVSGGEVSLRELREEKERKARGKTWEEGGPN